MKECGKKDSKPINDTKSGQGYDWNPHYYYLIHQQPYLEKAYLNILIILIIITMMKESKFLVKYCHSIEF